MPNIYTCPKCRHRYTIYHDGDYICDCGNVFSYPPILASEKACFIAVDAMPRSCRKVRVGNPVVKRENGFAGMLVRVLCMPLF